MLFHLKLSAFVAIGATISMFAQSSAPTHYSRVSPVLPKACLDQEQSEKVAALLESIRDHPTAGAYNTLGVLYAQSDRLNCAVPAFQAALKLEGQNWEAHYNLALALIKTGDRSGAKKELQAAIQQKPDSVSSQFALGSLFQNENKLDEAAEAFKATLNIDPHFVPASLKLSQVLTSGGKTAAAVACLEDALKLSPPADQNVALQASLGLAYVENGDANKGLETLKNLVVLQPNSAEAHFSLGLLYAKNSQPADQEAAVAQYREALRLDPGMDPARLALGRVLLSSGNCSDAMLPLQEYTKHKPGDGQGFHALGLAHKCVGRVNDSVDALKRAERLEPKNAEVHYYLGVMLAQAARTDEAIQELESAARIDPADPETHRQLALLLEKTGNNQAARAEGAKARAWRVREDEQATARKLNAEANQYLLAGNATAAVASYRRALELNPTDAKLHYNLSLALDKLGDRMAERKELEQAVELDPNLAVAQNQLGLLALQQGQATEAEQRFQKALSIDPKYAEAQSNLGVLYSQEGKNTEAASHFQQAIQSDPNYSKAYVNLGLTLAQQRAFAQAEQQFRTAIQVDPNNPGAYAALGMLEVKTGRGAEAVQTFRKALTLEPGSAEAHLNFGIALVDQYDRPDGFKEFTAAVRLDPNFAAAHLSLGRFFFEIGSYEEANRELEAAVRLQPNLVGALYFLALTEKQNNQLERSTECLERIVELQPDNADAQYLLGQNLERLGKSDAALEHWKAAVRADPDHSQALYNLARALSKMHDPEAQQYQDRFDALQERQQVTDRIKQLGNFALEAANAQNWPQAVAQMTEAIQLCGNCSQSAHLHRNLGLFYGRTGKINEAEKELRTALDLQPDDADAQKALTVLQNLQTAQAR
jgi:tetratricopeptide (TPR) repeat protein